MNWSMISTLYETRAASSILTLLVLAIIGMLLNYFWSRKVVSGSKRQKIKFRTIYLMLFIYVVLLAKIWVTGFTHIITVLSLVAAGLVVANKETVMNFIAALIIHWRNLFAEGDRVSIDNYSGIVTAIGVLYFTLNETSPNGLSRSSGKIIRVPNGLVITKPVINYSQNLNVLESDISLMLSYGNDVAKTKELLITCVKQVRDEYIKDRMEYTDNYILKRNHFAKQLLAQDPQIIINIMTGDHPGVEYRVCFYSYAKDQMAIRNLIQTALVELVQHHNLKLPKEESGNNT